MSSVTIFDIKRFAVHDGPGIRTTVFLKGCPLDCWWCHNPESRNPDPEEVTYERMLGDRPIASRKTYGTSMSASAIIKEILKDKLFYEESGGGVTFSGGEPMQQISVLTELLTECKRHGIHTTIDTCGYAPWSSFKKILSFTDLFLYDLKLMQPDRHKHFTGVGNVKIIKNLQRLIDENATINLRIPVVPGVNNSEEEVELLIEFLQQKLTRVPKIHLLPYHYIADNKYQKLKAINRMTDLEDHNGLSIKNVEQKLTTAGFLVETGG